MIPAERPHPPNDVADKPTNQTAGKPFIRTGGQALRQAARKASFVAAFWLRPLGVRLVGEADWNDVLDACFGRHRRKECRCATNFSGAFFEAVLLFVS